MTRGQKGCYVYSVDPETNAFLIERMGKVQAKDAAAQQPLRRRPHSFRVVPSTDVVQFENAVLLYELDAAAGVFGGVQDVQDVAEWVELPGTFRIQPGLFLTRVVGESMNRRIPNGAWCLFRANPTGSRSGRVVLAEHRDISDPDTGGRYTVKLYESEYTRTLDGQRSGSVTLRPDSSAGHYRPILFKGAEIEELRILAEFVAVVG